LQLGHVQSFLVGITLAQWGHFMGNFLNTRNINPVMMKNGPMSLNCILPANWLKSEELDSMTYRRNAMQEMARNLNRK